jgi:hypothetical protein
LWMKYGAAILGTKIAFLIEPEIERRALDETYHPLFDYFRLSRRGCECP